MRILLTGGAGFLGRHLARALSDAGHEVTCTFHSRKPEDVASTCARWISVDFTKDTQPGIWVPRLAGIDVVINAVGILRESGRQTFELLHVLAPRALFSACAAAGVRRVIQISALGADDRARSQYHLSKRRADEFLSTLPLDWTIVQPSIVYGPGGTSAGLFTMLAALPYIPVPGRGDQRMQLIHVDDVVDAIVGLLTSDAARCARIELVGREPLTWSGVLRGLRSSMKLGTARFIRIPLFAMQAAAWVGGVTRRGLLDRETLDMLLRGNTGDPGTTQQLLGRMPRSIEDFIRPSDAAAVRTNAQLEWLLPLVRWSIVLVWLVSGVVSLGLFPTVESVALLERVGIPTALAPTFLYGAALVDIAFGGAMLFARRRRALYLLQIVVIVLYSIVIAWWLPEFWLHPFGPLAKNLPILAGLILLYELEHR